MIMSPGADSLMATSVNRLSCAREFQRMDVLQTWFGGVPSMIVCSVAFVKMRDTANAYSGGPMNGPPKFLVDMPML